MQKTIEDGLVDSIGFGFVYMGVFVLFVARYLNQMFCGVQLFCRSPKRHVAGYFNQMFCGVHLLCENPKRQV